MTDLPPPPPPALVLNAHWDCSRGATGQSLFTACLEAWLDISVTRRAQQGVDADDDMNMEHASALLLESLHSFLQSMLPPLEAERLMLQSTPLKTPRFRLHWKNKEKLSMNSDDTSQQQQTQQALQAPTAHFQKAATLQQNLDTSDTITADDQNNIWSSYVYSVGIMWMFQDMKVVKTSMSPLPYFSDDINTETLQLLMGLPLQIMPKPPQQHGTTTPTTTRITPTAIAILKKLVLGNTTPTSSTSTTTTDCCFSSLQAVGVGPLQQQKSDGNQDRPKHGNDHDASVRLLVGYAATVAASSPPETTATASTPSIVMNPSSKTNLPTKQIPAKKWKVDRLIHMQANLDDITSEQLAFAVEVLLQQGAVDAWVAPIVMKKGRAAHTLHCLCKEEEEEQEDVVLWEKLVHLIFQHTTTLGIRMHRNLDRIALHRSFVKVQLTPYTSSSRQGWVDVKLGYYYNNCVVTEEEQDDNQDRDRMTVVSAKAEFDHCREISLETGVPIAQIAALAVQEAYKKHRDTTDAASPIKTVPRSNMS